MRVFVSEYVCGGGWPDEQIPESLASEGRAMLSSLISDLLRIPDVTVTTTWSAAAGKFTGADPVIDSSPLPFGERVRERGEHGLTANLTLHQHDRLVVRTVESTASESVEFDESCRGADAVIVIAPEFDDILLNRVKRARESSSPERVLGCAPDAIELCADKLRLSQFLNLSNVPSIPTSDFDPLSPQTRFPFPIVVKPRHGAGSFLTFRIDDLKSLNAAVTEIGNTRTGFTFIQQPFTGGTPLSCAGIFEVEQTTVLPVAIQRLSDDGRFACKGADLESGFAEEVKGPARLLIDAVLVAVPDLRGFVGFDLLLKPNGELLLVEINTRLTTSYLAWRQWTSQNLAEHLLFPERNHEPLQWNSEPLRFRLSDLPT